LSNRVSVEKGDIIRIVTTGGGGWGDPLDRETERVREDVSWGKVSLEGARRDYGVIFADEQSLIIDLKESEKQREKMRKERGKVPFFDHGPNLNALKKTEEA
jgi:N-methylhydantoinase B